MTTSAEQEFMATLEASPRAAADTLVILLDKNVMPAGGWVSHEWLLSIYENRATEVERACFRDAILLLLEADSEAATHQKQLFANIARDIGIFAFNRRRQEERVLRAAERFLDAGQASLAAPMLQLLASEGLPREEHFWSELANLYPYPEVWGPCVEGVLHQGSFQALDWIANNVGDPEIVQDIFAEYLMRFSDVDADGIVKFLDHAAATRFRKMLYSSLARYEISLPEKASEDVTPAHAAETIQSSELLRILDHVGATASTPREALEGANAADVGDLSTFFASLIADDIYDVDDRDGGKRQND